MKIISLIPARRGSKGIKDKNIKKLGKHPLLTLAIKASLGSKYISRTIVSTDSKKYAKIALKYGADVPFIRPKKFSGSNNKDYDVVIHLIRSLKLYNCDNCLIVYLRPTSPFRSPKILDNAIKIFLKKKSKIDSLRSVSEMSETAFKSFVIYKKRLRSITNKYKYLEISNSPRQKLKNTYIGNGLIDIYKLKFILKNKKLHGNNVYPHITKNFPEIDTLEDFKYAAYYKKGNLKNAN